MTCRHQPRCPDAAASIHSAARVVSAHPEQGWSLLCNGVLVFDDWGELLPDGCAVAPPRSRPAASHPPNAASCAVAARGPLS
jgi:hypothetical protein